MTPKTTHPAASLATAPDGHLACRFCGIATPENGREAWPVEADHETCFRTAARACAVWPHADR